MSEPPRDVWYTRAEARPLLADLVEARRTLLDSGHLTVVLFLEEQIVLLRSRLGLPDLEAPMSDEFLDLAQAS